MEVSEFNGVEVLPANRSGSSGAELADTFDNFLVLLTTQLQYQDPLSPLDAIQFTEQLVQFSGVEQAIATNDKLDDLIALQGGSQLSSAVSYIGKGVKADSDLIALQDGTATLIYGLEGNAASTTISIVNSAGQTVRNLAGDTAPGLHELVWDGLDGNGQPLPDGTYGLVVNAVDANNQAVSVATGASGRVTGVETQDGEVYLKLGDLLVPLTRVFAVDEIEEAAQTI
jgi:flagellar basal-body rod modification protein FlgD